MAGEQPAAEDYFAQVKDGLWLGTTAEELRRVSEKVVGDKFQVAWLTEFSDIFRRLPEYRERAEAILQKYPLPSVYAYVTQLNRHCDVLEREFAAFAQSQA
jgi:hypothetical protein